VILRVLGCSGSQTATGSPCSFLIDEETILEMGSAATVLPLDQQSAVRNILLSHAHLDHIKDLPFLVENVFQPEGAPIRVFGTTTTLSVLRQHIFNNAIWPDFAVLPTPEQAMLEYHEVQPREAFAVGRLQVHAIPVNHPGGCEAFLLESERGMLVYSGDTGPTEELWEAINARRDFVSAILVETFLYKLFSITLKILLYASFVKAIWPRQFCNLLL
jgi:ribonuclease BN (tRNA processing enzyme)